MTLTVTDGTGHSGQCTAVVTVVDALHFTQVAAPVATDGLAGDRLGHGVGLWGGVLVAGAPDDKVGTQSKQGAAYVFLQDAGGTDNWGQLKQVKASDGAAVDYFGNAVSVDGGLALVGAHGDNVGAATDAGSAYIYEKDHLGPDNWGQRAKFGAVNGGTPEPAAYDYFGNAVSLRGGRAVVGAAKKQVGPNAAQGAVYVHEKDAGGANAWGHVKKLVASDGGANNFFGQSVAQWGDAVLVGASGNLGNRGAAYLFGKDTGGAGNWGQGQKLTASDAAVGDGFGTSVSLTSGHAIIGAPNKSTYAGAAYIFKNDGGSWSQAKKLVASDGAPGDRFGTSVWLSGDHAYVSAVQAGGAGAVYVFHRDAGGAGNWGEVGKYQPSGGSPGERFGHALAASGDRVALGAPLSDVSGRVDQGRAYVLDGEDCGGLPRLQAGEQQTATATKRAPARGLALSAYPNPFADELRVELAIEAQAVAGTRVVLADATGRPVAEAEFAAGQAFAVLRTAALQPGMYFVQARTKAGLQVVPVALVR
ncbi:MAG: T9SS type A sorting domain-containing protein [Saprospiraceae bacterium]